MKKTIAWLLTAVMLTVTACGGAANTGAAAGRIRTCGAGVRSANVEQGRITGT